jgi:L-rhamnose mutarotase
MQHIGHVWKIRPGQALEYERRHARVWPELEVLLRDAGVRSFHIYRWGEIVFSHMEVEDYGHLTSRFSTDRVAVLWEAAFRDLIEYPNADPVTGWPERLQHIWSLGDGIANSQCASTNTSGKANTT